MSEDSTPPGGGTPILYVPELHFEQVERWNAARDEVVMPDLLPRTGFILPGKAAGFLFRTDSSRAFIEGLVAAPELRGEERALAIDAVVKAIAEEARRSGFRVLMGYTLLEAVVKRAERLGFHHVHAGFHLVALPLPWPPAPG